MPGGDPATMTTMSPSTQRPDSSRETSTWRAIWSVCLAIGTWNVSMPQVSASCERVAAFGGSLTTAPRPEGGFSVSARLPA